MSDLFSQMDENSGEAEALRIFEKEIGATGVTTKKSLAGNRAFLKFIVGREAPIYEHALRETQKSLSQENPFRGTLGLLIQPTERFPDSLESGCLQTLLTRSTRAVAEDSSEGAFSVPYVPFQNREDHQLAQPASHVVVGRRGVGKSTLIKRASQLIRASNSLVAILDVQAYSLLSGDDLLREILYDVVNAIVLDVPRVALAIGRQINTDTLRAIASDIISEDVSPAAPAPRNKRALSEITTVTKSHAYVFLDDFHLLNFDEQPGVLHLIHAALKGANGWIKVAGLR